MFFSIVVPLYNKANSVVGTLNSILSQDHGDFEIIVVNDGSTDDGVKRVMNIEDKRVRLLEQKNQGVSAARNNGRRASTSEHIIFFDADDIMGQGYLKHIEQLIGLYPEAGAYGTRYQYSRNNCLIPSRIDGLKDKPLRIANYFYTASKGDLPIVASGVCIPRKILSEVGGFPVSQGQGEDQDLWSRIGLNYIMAIHPSCDITYVLDAENRVSIDSIPSAELPYSQSLQCQLDEGNIPQTKVEDVKKYIAGHLIHLAQLNIENGQLKHAKKLLDDPRTKHQFTRKTKWRLKLLFKNLANALRQPKVTGRSSKIRRPVIANLLNDKKMGGILSVVKSLSQSKVAEKYEFSFQLTNPSSWRRKNLNSDIIMIHYASSWATIIPNLLTKILNPRSKMILQEHHYTANFENSVPSKLRFRIMLQLNYCLFSKVIAVSHGQAGWISDSRLLSSHKMVAIPQCRELNDFLSVVDKKSSTSLRVGAYGRLAPEKGFDKLIKAFNRLSHSNLKLSIAGSGPESERLEWLAKGNNAISFLGKVDNIPGFLETCDVIMIPSTTEAFGLVCLEAKAAARPVIASNIDGLREQVFNEKPEDQCGDLLYKNSVEEIHKVLEKLPKMPLKRWGESGRKQVRNAWNDYQQQWDNVFHGLVN
jgi:glycosyltransferase involved in cell wall biosynthesis